MWAPRGSDTLKMERPGSNLRIVLVCSRYRRSPRLGIGIRYVC